MEKEVWFKPSRAERKKVRREEAKERQEKHDSLSIVRRIYKLDVKFGFGVGAKKERAKLNRMRLEDGAS
jgi:hypothetical protein